MATLRCFPSYKKHPYGITMSFGAPNPAIAKDPKRQIARSVNGLKSASNSLLLTKRQQVFRASCAGTAYFIRAVSTVEKFENFCVSSIVRPEAKGAPVAIR